MERVAFEMSGAARWVILRHFQETHIFILQGEHKIFPWLHTFITRKLRGIQTYFFQNVTQLKKFLETNLSNGKKKISLFST